jgi:plasmid maintenance system antidote protein VapI
MASSSLTPSSSRLQVFPRHNFDPSYVAPNRILEIVKGKRAITADTALRLAQYLGTTPDFWLGLQMQYDLERAQDELAEKIQREVPQGAA